MLTTKKAKSLSNKIKNKKVEKLPIWGVMLTGQTKNFKALQNEPFVRGASIGVTAPIVPYIQPEK